MENPCLYSIEIRAGGGIAVIKLSVAVMCMGLAFLAGAVVAQERTQEVARGAQLYTLEGREIRVEGDGAVVGRQGITLDSAVLAELMAFGRRGTGELVLTLPLSFDREEAVLLNTAAPSGKGEFLLSGYPVARPGDLVVLLVSDGRLAGRLNVRDQHYMIRKLGTDHFLMRVDPGLLPPHAPPTLPKPSPSQGLQDKVLPHEHVAVPCKPEVKKTISVLVLYTGAARAGAELAAENSGSLDPATAFREDAILALGAANAALANSLADTRFGIAIQAMEVDYFETGDGYRALDHLYMPGHPLQQTASAERAAATANLVALIIEHWPEACGAAPVMIDWNTHPDQTAFSVVRRHCLRDGQYTLAHELAHSMGSAHDPDNARVPGLFEFSYGHNAPEEKHSTIMAYQCPGCAREKNYSNPGVAFLSDGTVYTVSSGVECPSADPDCRPADNAQSIDRAACQVATWQ
jgi:hypothetical protein